MKDRTDIESINTDHTRHPAALVELNEAIRSEVMSAAASSDETEGPGLQADFAFGIVKKVAITAFFWLQEAEERVTEDKEKTARISNIREKLEELQSDAEAASSSSGDATQYADDASNKVGDLLCDLPEEE